MFKLNSVILAGNLTRDVQCRYTSNNKAVASISIAVNRSVKQSDGTWKDVPDYIPVVLWGKNAENAGKFLHKGDNILVRGRVTTRSYEANTPSGTEKKYVTEVIAEDIQFPPKSNGYGNVTSNAAGSVTENYGHKNAQNWSPLSTNSFDSPPPSGDEASIPF